MRRFISFFSFVFVLSYSMHTVAIAAEEQVMDEGNEIISVNEIVSGNEIISFNQEEEKCDDLILDETGVSVNENEVMDIINDDCINEEVNISSNEQTDISSNELVDVSANEISDVNQNEENNLDSEAISLNGISSNESVSDNEVEKAEVEDEADSLSKNGIAEISSEENAIPKVEIPVSARVYLDPGRIVAEGGVFSDDYKVINYGTQDVLIKIKDVQILQRWGKDLYELSEDTPNDAYMDKIKVDLDMVWRNRDEDLEKTLKVVNGDVNEYVIYLRAAQYDENGEFIKVNNGSEGEFCFTGNLETNSNMQWENSGMRLNFSYEIVDDEQKVAEFLGDVLSDKENDVNKKEEINE